MKIGKVLEISDSISMRVLSFLMAHNTTLNQFWEYGMANEHWPFGLCLIMKGDIATVRIAYGEELRAYAGPSWDDIHTKLKPHERMLVLAFDADEHGGMIGKSKPGTDAHKVIEDLAEAAREIRPDIIEVPRAFSYVTNDGDHIVDEAPSAEGSPKAKKELGN